MLSSSALGAKFTAEECLHANFRTEINHDGKYFGLIKNKLIIEKKQCLFEISFKNILETIWKIDICRDPIHMKVKARGGESVYKRKGRCSSKKSSDYCAYWDELNETVQDYGLIFAQGAREELNSSHGQTYCSYLLLTKYLYEGQLFSKYDATPKLFEEKLTEEEKPEVKIEVQADKIIENTQPPVEEPSDSDQSQSEESGMKF